MPRYSMSNGEMIDKKKIDINVTNTKKQYIENFIDEHGYKFCERTERSDLPVECSHIISVKECQNNGTTGRPLRTTTSKDKCVNYLRLPPEQ